MIIVKSEGANFHLKSEYSGILIRDNKDRERGQILNFRKKWRNGKRWYGFMIEAVCFDLGDTLIAEESVIHDSSGQAITANVIEDAFEVLKAIREGGYKVAIIANGDSNSCRNIIKVTGLQDYFDTIIISEEAGIEKPDQKIFNIALAKLDVKAENTVMVGNRIDADVIGANRIGMKSVWFKWNNRYKDEISNREERPDFIIKELAELPQLLSVKHQDL